MARALAFSLAALGLTAALTAGCVGPPPRPSDYHAVGQGPAWFTVQYAYDGRGVQAFTGSILIHANDQANTGTATVEGTLAGSEWKIMFDRFAEQPGKTFQDGGIASDLQEHGATGVADASIPEVHVQMAAWGEANVTLNGRPLPDPITGESTWAAHYMVIATGVRDDETGGIWNANRSAPYDPKKPSDGHSNATDPEVHLVLKSHRPPDANASRSATGPVQVMNPVAHSNSFRFNNSYQGTQAHLYFNASATPSLRLTELDFVLLDPAGNPLANVTLGGGTEAQDADTVDVALPMTGTYTVAISGQGPATYNVDAVLVPPPNVVLNFWWETVLTGAEAEAVESSHEASHSP